MDVVRFNEVVRGFVIEVKFNVRERRGRRTRTITCKMQAALDLQRYYYKLRMQDLAP